MTFAVPPEGYDSFMGRYSRQLAPLLAHFAGVRPGVRALDVGCGPGALTEVLAGLIGPAQVGAADPSPGFAAACAARVPGADVRTAAAETLPWEDAAFDVALAQLVVEFMGDPGAGVREMRRTVKPGGTVAACTWEADGGMTMLHAFWEAAVAVDPAAPAEPMRLGRPGPLRELWASAGFGDVAVEPLDVECAYEDFDSFWRPFTGGVGPAGAYLASLAPDTQAALREEGRRRLGDPQSAFRLSARAWAVRGRVPG
ncbi:MAG TPA: class I SAM-dependent methyltransferase [Conexibacter sp.]|jgi:SAM-dependent methyltransferase|nr:class I SAM-dependent methyltransferase [Conexibacter sp.]